MKVQKRILYLLDQLLAETDAEVGQEWSITRPGDADKDDPDYLTSDVLVCYRLSRSAGISRRRAGLAGARCGPD